VLLVLALLLGICPLAQADLGDDQYLQIYTLIQQADELNSNGEAALAKAKYREAQKALKSFKTDYPNWNVQLVASRLNYLAQKLGDPLKSLAPLPESVLPATRRRPKPLPRSPLPPHRPRSSCSKPGRSRARCSACTPHQATSRHCS
jgi:hypothetical protein